jgi:hypothetical protein
MDKTLTLCRTAGVVRISRKKEKGRHQVIHLIHGDISGRSLFLDSLIFVLEHDCGERSCEVRSLQNKNLE